MGTILKLACPWHLSEHENHLIMLPLSFSVHDRVVFHPFQLVSWVSWASILKKHHPPVDTPCWCSHGILISRLVISPQVKYLYNCGTMDLIHLDVDRSPFANRIPRALSLCALTVFPRCCGSQISCFTLKLLWGREDWLSQSHFCTSMPLKVWQQGAPAVTINSAQH